MDFNFAVMDVLILIVTIIALYIAYISDHRLDKITKQLESHHVTLKKIADMNKKSD